MSELHDLTALDQATLVRRREVSPLDLVDHYLAREDRVGAFITATPDLARDRARRLTGDPSSPLFGVPTAIKDLHPTRGVRTTFGSAVYADHVPRFSDAVVTSLEGAGLISLGKTNTPEFGSPCYTEPDVAPPAVTPWDPTRTAGGSSGGAAAAVAAGLLPVAPGSDGGGSIRIPAACCGLVGLKPSRGRVSAAPLYGDPVGLATAGPIARTVRDAAALLDVMAGPVVGDPFPAPAGGGFLAACDREPRRLRIARFCEPIIADVTVAPECLLAWEDASRLLVELGHDVIDVPRPLPRSAVRTFEVCWAVLTALTPVPEERRSLLRPLTRWLIDWGESVSGPVFGQAMGELRRVAARALIALATYDAVLTPTLASLPVPVGALRHDADPAADFEAQKAFTPWTSAWNVTGMPAVSVPLAWTADELPVGVMLAGRPGEEETLLSLAAQVEAAAPWRHRTPPGW